MLTRFLPFLTTYLTPVDILLYCYKVKSLYTIDISSTTYLPHLVNVVKECPLMYNLFAGTVVIR